MAFPSDFLDEVRARIGLANLIGRRVRLSKRGREHVGLCPFHKEKTPSFTVNEDKGFYHCFGCGAHGTHFDFVMQTEGLRFPEAVERLAADAGVPMPVSTPASRAREAQQTSLYRVVEQAAGSFAERLRGPEGLRARQYLEARGLSPATIAEFGLGLAPDRRTALKEAMLSAGIEEQLLVEAGLLIAPEDSGPSFDRFRDRIIFPIADARGRVIAFGGRALGEARAKYLNSPETPLFRKGRVLYNLARARKAAHEAGTVVVAEGYMDVIALHQAGFANAVAPLGTALTEDHIGLLWRLAPEPVLCLDGDAAGRRAAERAAHRCLPLVRPGHSLRFAFLPWGEDPDSLAHKHGPGAITDCIQAAVPLSEVLWQDALGDRVLDTPERRAAVRRSLAELSGRIGDATVRAYYRDFFETRLADLFGSRGEAGRMQEPRSTRARGARLQRGQALGSGEVANSAARERLLILTLLNHPGLLPDVAEELSTAAFVTPELDSLAQALLDVAAGESSLDFSGVRRHLSDRGLGALIDRVERARSSILEPWARPDADEAQAERGWRHVLARHRLAVAVTTERREAVAALAEGMTDQGLARLRALQAQWETGEGNEVDIDAGSPHAGTPG